MSTLQPDQRDAWTAMVGLVRAGLAAGLRLRRSRTHYTPESGVLRWSAGSSYGTAVVVEHWTRCQLNGEAWKLEVYGPAGKAEARHGLTPHRAAKLLIACEVLPDPAQARP